MWPFKKKAKAASLTERRIYNGYPKDNPTLILIDNSSSDVSIILNGEGGAYSSTLSMLSVFWLSAYSKGWRGPGIEDTETHVFVDLKEGLALSSSESRSMSAILANSLSADAKSASVELMSQFSKFCAAGGFRVVEMKRQPRS